MKKLLLVLLLFPLMAVAQEYHGTTGLLHVPSAETDSTGTFRGGGMYLNREFTPDQLSFKGETYNTFTYGIGLTAFKWLEVAYRCTLLKMYKNNDRKSSIGYYNEDRRVNLKVVPLYEGKWWPAIALGMDDVGRFKRIRTGTGGNNYFQNIYIVGSKHFNIRGNELGAHLCYRYYSVDKNKSRRGVAGGLTFRPAFYRPLRFVAEWDGECVNVGADVLLWRHLFAQVGLTNGKYFLGGLSYHYTIKH